MNNPIPLNTPVRSLYVQVPFCPERCDYCSIPVSVRPDRADGYIRALAIEKERVRSRTDLRTLKTLYLGGGTPTILEPALFSDLIDVLVDGLDPFQEVTTESRPDTLTLPILKMLEKKSVTRLSIGIETVSPVQMTFLGRTSGSYDIVHFIDYVRNIFSGQISMDFIIGGTGYDPNQFRSIAGMLLEAGLDHLSVYPLTFENRTVLTLRNTRGEIPEETGDEASEAWCTATSDLRSMGWNQYEVANFSRNAETVCQHNLSVWEGHSYLGMGAGAHQRINDVRNENVRSYVSYESRLARKESPSERQERLSADELFLEVLYTNARLSYGFPKDWLDVRINPYDLSRFLSRMVANRWVREKDLQENRIVFTPEGWQWLDDLIGELSGLIGD
ncbi:MAG: coproporphyrinogen-III oxidase family protein [Leptospirales bacterium]